jgi:hypothetical protein
MPGRWGVHCHARGRPHCRGEEWLQTNTLDGQKAHDVFTRIGEPSYFQEFGPANTTCHRFRQPGDHQCPLATFASARPNSPQPGVAYTCNNTITGKVTGERLSRTPDERLYSSGSHDTYYWTQCYVSFGDPDGEDFAFTKCNADGTFTLSGASRGRLESHRLRPVERSAGGRPFDACGAGGGGPSTWETLPHPVADQPLHPDLHRRQQGWHLAVRRGGNSIRNVAVRLRDGSLENLLVTDFTGTANFNETFPLFNWYTVETDVTRYKNTGTHVVYDVGGPADGSAACGHRLSAVRHLHNRQVPGQHGGNRLCAHQPARAGLGLLRKCGLHRQVDSATGNAPGTSDPPSVARRPRHPR